MLLLINWDSGKMRCVNLDAKNHKAKPKSMGTIKLKTFAKTRKLE